MREILISICLILNFSCLSDDKYSQISKIPETYLGKYILISNGEDKLTIEENSIVLIDRNKTEYQYKCNNGVEKRISGYSNEFYQPINIYPNNPDDADQYFHLYLKKSNNHLFFVEYIPTGFNNELGSIEYEYLKISN